MHEIKEFAKDLGIISSYFKREMSSIKFDTCTIKDCITIEKLLEKDLPMSELSEILNLTPSATTTHIDRLIEMEVVKRELDIDDRRKIYVVLSKKGVKIGKEIFNHHLRISEDILKTLNEKECKIFVKLINKVSTNLC